MWSLTRLPTRAPLDCLPSAKVSPRLVCGVGLSNEDVFLFSPTFLNHWAQFLLSLNEHVFLFLYFPYHSPCPHPPPFYRKEEEWIEIAATADVTLDG